MTPRPTFRLRLFYSYSHRDSQHRQRMEDALVLLRTRTGYSGSGLTAKSWLVSRSPRKFKKT